MAPAQEADPQAKLKSLFTKLDAALKSQTGSLKKTLKLIDPILALAPGDADALKCKAIVLIQHDEFRQALDCIADSGSVADELVFEKAYCYYRLGQLEQALSTVQQVPEERRLARLQLQAQLHYWLGDNKQAIKVYSELFQAHKVESQELRTNVLAAYVCGGRAAQVPEIASAMQITAADSSDIGFNMACALLQLRAFGDAEQQLQLALRTGREALLEEEVSEDEAAEELAPLSAQLAYAQAALGQRSEARAAYQALEALEGLDAPTAAVVRNNLVADAVATSGAAAPKKAATDALKRLEPLTERSSGGGDGQTRLAPALEARLMDSQKAALLGNRAALLLGAQKPEAAELALRSLAVRFPSYHRLPLLHAALLAHAGKVAEAAAVLEGPAGEALGLPALLMRAQLLLAGSDSAGALALLRGLPDESLRHQPALVATVASLQEQEGDQAGVIETLQAALQWWRNSMEEAPAGGENPEHWLLQRLVVAAIAAGDDAEARRLHSELAAAGATAVVQAEALAALAAAHGVRHEAGVEELAAGLPAIDAVDPAVISTLETAAAASAVRRPKEDALPAAAAIAATAPAVGGVANRQKSKKKKRKPRLPKGVDPENPGPPPDAERWLPKWQRSDFKKPRNRATRKAKEAMKGSQGQGRVDESLDISKHAAPEPSGAAPPGKAAVKGAGGRRKGRR